MSEIDDNHGNTRTYHPELLAAAYDIGCAQVFTDEARQVNLYRAQDVLEAALAQAVAERDEAFAHARDLIKQDERGMCELGDRRRENTELNEDLARVTAERDEAMSRGDEWAALVADLREALRVRGEQSVLLAEALKFYADEKGYNESDSVRTRGVVTVTSHYGPAVEGDRGEVARQALEAASDA